jgi:hypothetical protein
LLAQAVTGTASAAIPANADFVRKSRRECSGFIDKYGLRINPPFGKHLQRGGFTGISCQ